MNETKKNRSVFKWWIMFAVHNCVAHPLLVVAEIFDVLATSKWLHASWCSIITKKLHQFHDVTIADGDILNLIKLLRK